MNTVQLIQSIRAAYTINRPLLVRSSPGMGKSACILAGSDLIAQDLGLVEGVRQWGDVMVDPKNCFGYVDVRLSQCDPVDVGGLPYADEARGVQSRYIPDWFPSTDRTDLPDFGFLVLEEVVSAAPAVQAAAYQLTHDRRICDRVMKAGWRVILTGNKLTDGGVVYKLATPLANRMMHIEVETEAPVWRNWAIDAGLDNSIIAYIGLRPDYLNTFEQHVTKKLAGDAFASERSWHIANDIVKANLPDDVMYPLLVGTVGAAPAADYMGFRKIWQSMPNIDHILLDPTGAPVPMDIGTQYAVATGLAARATKDNFGAVTQYADRFRSEAGRADLTAVCIKDATRRTPACATTSAFAAWASRNADMLS